MRSVSLAFCADAGPANVTSAAKANAVNANAVKPLLIATRSVSEFPG